MKNNLSFALVLAALVGTPGVALAQSTTEQLELAERDFQRATLERGVEGWNSFFADSGAQLQNTSRIVRGHAAIRELMGEFLASKTERLIWWPVATELSEHGEMAYTFGASGVVAPDSAGKLAIDGRGTYLTVWRRQHDGAWKVAADMGGQASARALEHAADTAAATEIIRLEAARSDAIAARDRAALERIYSFDFLGIRGTGPPVDRSTIIPELLNASKFVLARVESPAVTVAGESGYVNGVLRNASDAGTVTYTSFLHIYVRRAGKWQLVRGISGSMK
ncbi:MAG: nuclear transport factor 2 family protein [Gemmatimonadaceae bacterium]|nr:nuclear transport factor 2 family protein [Gemmatimonadaceae bacterium]